MPITIDTTIGGASANSYNTIAQLDAYALGVNPDAAAAWAALATDDAKAPFAVRATRILDTIAFPGTMVAFAQALQWPRWGVVAPVGFAFGVPWSDYYYPPDVIPPAVLAAHAALAVFLAVHASSDPFGPGDAGPLSALKVGAVDLTFREGAQTVGRDFLAREIYPILAAGKCAGAAHSVRLSR